MKNLFARGAFLLGAVAMAAIIVFGDAVDSDDSPQLQMDGILRECAQFPTKNMNMDGVLTLMEPIVCNDTAVTIHIEKELVVHAIKFETTNIHFVVHSGGRLTVKASRSVIIKRDDSSTKPLLDIDGGHVKIEAGGYIPDDSNNTKEDSGGVVNVKQEGSLSLNSQAKMMYTGNSIIVSHKSPKHAEDNGDVFTSVPYKDTAMFAMEERYQQYLRSKTSQTTNDDNAGPPPSPPATASIDESADDPKGTATTTDKPTSSPLLSHTDTTRPTLNVPTRNSRWVKRSPTAEPRRSELSVNRVLLGKLSADDDVSALWGAYDGAVVFGRRDHAPADGEQVPFARLKTLIAPSDKQVDEVYRARALLREMEADDDNTNGRRTDWTDNEIQTAKRAKENLRHVDMVLTDRACLTVSLDGICVLKRSGPYKREWMNRFPWRRKKSDQYVLRATKDGLEVLHEERKVWGISVGKLD